MGVIGLFMGVLYITPQLIAFSTTVPLLFIAVASLLLTVEMQSILIGNYSGLSPINSGHCPL